MAFILFGNGLFGWVFGIPSVLLIIFSVPIGLAVEAKRWLFKPRKSEVRGSKALGGQVRPSGSTIPDSAPSISSPVQRQGVPDFGRPFTSSSNRYSSPTYRTLRGDMVRSRAEVMIADYLYYKRVMYSYETELRDKNAWRQRGIARPDFFLSDFNVYVEYWGLLDADDPSVRNRYVGLMKKKTAIYSKQGIKVVYLFPSDLEDLDTSFRAKYKRIVGTEAPF
jgi:hypothetical protein